MTNELPNRIHIPCPRCKACNHVVENLTPEEVKNVAEFNEIEVFDLDYERLKALSETEVHCENCNAIIKVQMVIAVQIEAFESEEEKKTEQQNAPTVETLQ